MSHQITKPAATINVSQMEAAVLKTWEKDQTFERSLQQTAQGPRFTFYDGPPFATGLPHYGHLLQGTLKDIFPRFKTMQGYQVARRWGWDCHGLPVEYELEKERGIKSRQEILEMGVDTFNEACRAIVLRHTKEWRKTITRMGRWIDFDNAYRTMDPDYMESIWWVVKSLWDNQLLYEGKKSMHICPRCATPLSNFEVSQAYADRQDPAVFVKFPLVNTPGTSLVAWTTTPWTLPGNVLLAVNEKFKYVSVEHQGETLIMAASRVAETFEGNPPKTKPVKIVDLIGQKYQPAFSIAGLEGKQYEVVTDDSVTEDEGTGVLHVAPAFGEDDMRIGEREQAAFVQHITINGTLTEPFDRYHDKTALEANQPLIADLKKVGRLLRQETITHSYPHCWRCKTPLLNYATNSWFVKVTALKDRLLAENKKITWVPDHVRDGRFGRWLEGARDWAISRNRFWGNPLPIWKCEEGHVLVIGSRDELEKLSGERPDDLHKHFVDKVEITCPDCSGTMRRIEDVLDCWFESGSMPYAEQHYPFEHQQEFKERFPADFIAEGLDQTRGWFYTLHVLSVALKDSRAYEHVVTTGMVLAEDGKEMSKSLRNYPEPGPLFENYGADAARLYMVLSPIVRGEDLRFSEAGVQEITRNFTLTLWNVYSFFATYAAIDGWSPGKPPLTPKHVLDRWILSRLASLTAETTERLNSYDLVGASRGLLEFVNELSNWYVRRSRRRFWKSEDDADKAEAYATLHHVLTTFCRLAAPVTPFVTEHLYGLLTGEESVHLTDWPKPVGKPDQTLEADMALARDIVSLGLAARSASKLKVRQPLAAVKVSTHGRAVNNKEIVQIIAEELNVKEVAFTGDDDSFATAVAVPNPKVIGPLAGKDAQRVIKAVKAGKYESKKAGWQVGDLELPEEAITLSYRPGKQFVVESTGQLVVGLDTTLTDDLKSEGLARELVRALQEERKRSGLEVSDRISLSLSTTDPDLERAITTHRQLIADEVLASSLEVGESPGDNRQHLSVDGHAVVVRITKS